MATYKQVDIVTESKQRGGYRENSGRKLKHNEPTATIRLPVSMIERIKSGSFENVTESKQSDNSAALIAEIEALKKASEYLENQNRDLKNTIDKLKKSQRAIKLKESEKQCDKLYQQILSLECQLNDSRRNNNNLKKEIEGTELKYQNLINLSVSDFAGFQKRHFAQFGKPLQKNQD